ncbi:MAG TPA: helix-turn-helix transcriptional regulator [Pyrinomonadaceae bacterium]|nr:helix-turn-helix transcriptional regulator [Pyrinomonadaceae bacterium]
MGTKARHKPERLAEKLLRIREALGLSQNGLIRQMGAEELLAQNTVSEYELGKREPSLLVLLKYAGVAGVCLDVLANDNLDLPAKLPAKPKHS